MKKIEYKSLSEIQKEKEDLTYVDLLSTTEWKSKRDLIVNRDNLKCTNCGKEELIVDELDSFRNMTKDEESKFSENARKEFLTFQHIEDWMKIIGRFPRFAIPMVKKEDYVEKESIILHVHHKYYIKDKYPWEYKDSALTTVCTKCHTYIHETENILVYENDHLNNSKVAEKCVKCGGTGYLDQYHYYINGICFRCNGNGIKY